ncbi:MAG: zinc-dependent metalloprotease family protein, partial [Bacteroidota bacterium]
MYRLLFCCVVLCSVGRMLSGQSVWSDFRETGTQKSSVNRWIIPDRYRSLKLDIESLRSTISKSGLKNGDALIIDLPLSDGQMQAFSINESSIMEPGLEKRFPEIKTYIGVATDGSGDKVYLDMTPKGLHGMILSASGTTYIDPYYRHRDDTYVSYAKRDYSYAAGKSWSCGAEAHNHESSSDQIGFGRKKRHRSNAKNSTQINMRTHRIAIAATGEYTAFHSMPNAPNVAAGQAAIVTAMNRVRGIYEDEVAVSFVIVAENANIVFTDAESDSLTNDSGPALINQIQDIIDDEIGSANYDIGHVFSTGGGGLAGLGIVCSSVKAEGVTGLAQPTGDPFWVDFVAHEIGHQYGGRHTFNSTTGNCSGGNRSGLTAYEPLSGTTIQGYSGICGNDNTQDNSDPYFH